LKPYATAMVAVVLEKTGKLCKRQYSLTGGSVGLFEGKKLGVQTFRKTG